MTNKEQAAFEKWLKENDPSGDSTCIHLQWTQSSEYAALFNCPECGSPNWIQIDDEGNAVTPESTFFMCYDCGYASDPE